jgi:hypothetical protein
MSAAPSLSGPALAAAHRAFCDALPPMNRTLDFQFRRWPARRRQEAIADAQGAAWAAWHGLLLRGQDPRAVGVCGIAFNAARSVKRGRTLGSGTRGRGADVLSRYARRRLGFRVISLDRVERDGRDLAPDAWREWVAADSRYATPADAAAFRLDFASWLAGLPARQRRTAELLAEGHETGVVARVLGVTSGRVSQVRRELEAGWRAFQGQAEPEQHRPAVAL